jgi:threonine dehydratase
MTWEIPTLTSVLAARQRIRPYLPPTPLHTYSALNRRIGTEVYVKHENYQPVGAFKVRGGVNLIAQMTAAERARGVIGASTGNHGQSIAFAARLFGVPARIVVPEGANPGKVAAMQGMGAEVIFYGAKFDDARQHCEQLAASHGYRYIHSGNEPHLIAGVGTITLEMLETQPAIEVIIVPVGGGSGAAGAAITAHGINPAIQVIGVQSNAATSAYASWQQRQSLARANDTVIEGLATGSAFELPQQIMWEQLNDFVLVSDEAILQAVVWLLDDAHTLAEGAGAAPLAAAWHLRDHLAGKKVGLVCSGGNLSRANLQRALRLGD